jgi:hypothetical protein
MGSERLARSHVVGRVLKRVRIHSEAVRSAVPEVAELTGQDLVEQGLAGRPITRCSAFGTPPTIRPSTLAYDPFGTKRTVPGISQ